MNHLDVVENHGDMSLKDPRRWRRRSRVRRHPSRRGLRLSTRRSTRSRPFRDGDCVHMDLYGPMDGQLGDEMQGSRRTATGARARPRLHRERPTKRSIFTTKWGWGTAHEDSLMMRVLHHNLRSGPEFLGLRKGGGVLGPRGHLLGTRGKLEDAVDFIRNIRQNRPRRSPSSSRTLPISTDRSVGPTYPTSAKNSRRSRTY